MKRYAYDWDENIDGKMCFNGMAEAEDGDWVRAEDAIKQHQDDLNELDRLSARVRDLEALIRIMPEDLAKASLEMRGFSVCTPAERAVLDAMAGAKIELRWSRAHFVYECDADRVCEAELARREAK